MSERFSPRAGFGSVDEEEVVAGALDVWRES
jgi:hypothetical protein